MAEERVCWKTEVESLDTGETRVTYYLEDGSTLVSIMKAAEAAAFFSQLNDLVDEMKSLGISGKHS